MFNEIVKKAEELCGNTYGITVYENGQRFSHSFKEISLCNNSYSVAKAFTMTAIGMLEDMGRLSTEDYITDIFKDEMPAGYDKLWDEVKVRHALTHSIGFENGFLDIDVEDIFSYGTDDFLKVVLSHPIRNKPGSAWRYSDAAFYLLSRVVSKKSGMTLVDFLMPRLFMPLKFNEVAWSSCPHGYSMGATGLYIRTQDMCKLGEVYMCDGTFEGREIVSKRWVDKALSEGFELSLQNDEKKIYAKGGMAGQMLCFSRKNKFSVAWHAFENKGAARAILDYIISLG